MKSFRSRLKCFSFLAVLLIGLIGCSTSGGDNTGRLSLSLTDKSAPEYQQVWVTITDVYAHKDDDPEGSWTKILTVDRTINLLTLAGGIREELGMVDLAPGHYTQMRLMIGTTNFTNADLPANYIVNGNGNHPLKIPSGVQSGVKLVQGFDINDSSTTRLIFDFEVAASIVVAGNSGKYILRPTIHQIDDSQTRTNILGTVKDSSDTAIAGAAVDLQIFKARVTGQDYKDEITTYGSTTTDSSGKYLFWFLNIPTPITLDVVATNWSPSDNKVYAPAWDQVEGTVNGNAYERNFVLANPDATQVGQLKLRAIVNDNDSDKVADNTLFVTISVRQQTALTGTPWVEVKKLVIVGYDDEWTLASINTIDIDLPAGNNYEVVASVDGRPSLLETNVVISSAQPKSIDFSFPKPTV
jgi:hypothetical protein